MGAPFGPFRLRCEKPFSRTFTNASGTAFLKEYRGIEPSLRQEREVIATARADGLGVSVPEVLGAGSTDSTMWTVFRHLPGHVGTVRTRNGLNAFVEQVIELGRRIHPAPPGTPPGAGWNRSADDAPTHRGFLMGQFSSRARARPWWDDLGTALESLALEPVVYLHGDLKAEHFISSGDRVSVVDWEACARGPAACDHADALFHALRDLLYLTSSRRIQHERLERLQVPGPVMAWRILLWLDRRPALCPNAATRRSLRRLMEEPKPMNVSRIAAHAITEAFDLGVPR
ncbi:phosphotransferase family protein [Nocardiopsis sp. CC223A]|uniref:phosphotransferase family protein n=1 Tax=Nocardiopsis sp. CC223A TaxID=3044051 RepID=UPI00278BD7FE|nr:phosphotransferase [Nocardiopsis sp. CC223A]